MMKSVILILIILLGSSGLAFVGRASVPGPFELQGAKIVSEGAYFWVEITNNWGTAGGRGMESEVLLGFPSDFSLHGVCITNREISETVWTVKGTTLQIAVSLDPLDKLEILLSAPFLANNETVRHVVINIGIISALGGAVFVGYFHMSVVGLAFLPGPDSLETEYAQLLTENANLNMTVAAMQSQVMSLNDQVASLTRERDTLNQRAASLNTEVANLNSRLIQDSYAIILAILAVALATGAATCLAVHRRIPTQTHTLG